MLLWPLRHSIVSSFQSEDAVSPVPLMQVDAAKFWVQLSNIKWCPVLRSSPAPGLPWPPQQDQLALPRAVRPQADMWLCSSCMRILDGQCRSASLAVAGLLLATQPCAMRDSSRLCLPCCRAVSAPHGTHLHIEAPHIMEAWCKA